jgi:hypothetical protein
LPALVERPLAFSSEKATKRPAPIVSPRWRGERRLALPILSRKGSAGRAVAERHQQKIMRTVRGKLAEVMTQLVEKTVRKLIAVAVKAHRVDRKLHRVLAEQIHTWASSIKS